MTRPRLCIIGDALLDVDWEGEVRRVCRDAPAPVVESPVERVRPGGAALAAQLAAGAGAEVTLVTALATDADGRRLAGLLADAGVAVVDLGLDGPTPVKLRLRSGGQSLARVDRGCEPVVPPGPWSVQAGAAADGAHAVLVADYGRGVSALPEVTGLPAGPNAPPVVWDPHSAGPRPPRATALATPNVGEALDLLGDADPAAAATVPGLVTVAGALATSLGSPVALTAAARGAVLAEPGALAVVVPTHPARGDACGAGDAFAVHAALALACGAGRRAAVEAGVAGARRYVAGRDHTAPAAGPEGATGAGGTGRPGGDGHVVPLDGAPGGAPGAAAVRRAGGVVVAAGGCFDVLHAGHVQLLEQARRLGDHLVVLLNGDSSVRRLKGAGRPLNPVADRAAVLGSLACVDEVVAFDEDTPSRALRALRPHLFVKGADYEGADIEERHVMARWGGQVVLVPLVDGRSTTRLIRSAAAAGA
ncbi:MAG TPA: adenylyltransferase/cytidyltransferase family protein [Acidimicrobiales bacterium]|nr:adenylyltransferase/cytidyltransferase family protein [Acidimicrobiales bacterium]